MKYFFDTEFLEGTQKTFFGKSKPTIDLISIGIVDEDGREYYAISKEFNLKEAWYRWQQRTGEGDRNNIQPRLYWIRENVLRPLFHDLRNIHNSNIDKMNQLRVNHSENWLTGDEFSFTTLKKLLKKYGKTNLEIKNGIIDYLMAEKVATIGNTSVHLKKESADNIRRGYLQPEFYGYYADYDWVVFCWLFGKMIDLPKGFPMNCKDLKQSLDTYVTKWRDERIKNETKPINFATWENYLTSVKNHPKYPIQKNEHNALDDAKWNFELFKFLETVRI